MRLGRVTLRPVRDDDRERLLSWRNLPEVRRFMFRDGEISPEEHQRWFAGLLGDPTREYWIIEVDGHPLGAANLYDIDFENGRTYWGLYLADEAVRGQGIGSITEYLVLRHAFEELKLNKLVAEVVAFNEPALRMYESFGYHRDGVLRQHIKRGGVHHDVMVFSLLRAEWEESREDILERLWKKGVV